jgi:hypothetical protein
MSFKITNIFSRALHLSHQGQHQDALTLLCSIPDKYLTPDIHLSRAILMRITENNASFNDIEQAFLKALKQKRGFRRASF